MTGLILAAGMGNRMGDLTMHTSKVLLEIGGKTLLGHACSFMRSVGCDRIVVVGGYHFERVAAYVHVSEPDVVLVENPDFRKQNMFSFIRGIAEIANDDVCVCNSDYVFGSAAIERITSAMPSDSVTVVCSSDIAFAEDDVMKVCLRNGVFVGMSKQYEVFDLIYSGIFFVPVALLEEVRLCANALVLIHDDRSSIVELLFGALLEKGVRVDVLDIGLSDWVEIDTPEEYERALRQF